MGNAHRNVYNDTPPMKDRLIEDDPSFKTMSVAPKPDSGYYNAICKYWHLRVQYRLLHYCNITKCIFQTENTCGWHIKVWLTKGPLNIRKGKNIQKYHDNDMLIIVMLPS